MNAEIFFELSPYAQCCLTFDLYLIRWNAAFEQLINLPVWESDAFLQYISVSCRQKAATLLGSLQPGEIKDVVFEMADEKAMAVHWRIQAGPDQKLYLHQLPLTDSINLEEPISEPGKLPYIPASSLLSLAHHSTDMIARFDRQLRYTFVNDELLRQTNQLKAEQFLGRTTREMAPFLGVSETNFTRWTHDLQQVLNTGEELMHYDHLQLPTHTLHFQTKMFPESTSGEISGVLVITRIINELKNSENKLREQKNLLKMVFDCMQEGVMVVDTAQNFILTNKPARTAIAIDLSTKNYTEWAMQVDAFYPDKKTVLPLEELPAIQALNGKTVNDHLGYYKLKQANQGIYLSVNASPLTDAEGILIGAVVVFNNVSERIKTQEQIASSLATLHGIIESTQDMVVAIDRTYTILSVNSSGRESFKISTGITIEPGTNLLAILAHTPEVAEGVRISWAKALAGETYIILHELANPDGSVTSFESVYSPIYNEKEEVIGATMVGRDVTLKRKQEEEIKSLLNRLLSLNQQLEEKNKALLTGEEELSAANEELKTQQEELRQTVDELASRNFELDQLVYKTSHDIRSPLTSILGLANVMKAEKDTSQWPLYLGHIENRVLTLDRFVQSMISYAKANRNAIQAQLIDFESLLEQAKHDLAYMKGFESIDISLAYTGEQVPFYGDLFRLQILFNNIVSNAIKYQNPYVEHHYLRVYVNLSPTQAQITFTDNGIGIKADHIARIFDMFYRATEHTDGSGLGLYIVKQTVEKMKGKISLESEYGKMTTFRVVLPNTNYV